MMNLARFAFAPVENVVLCSDFSFCLALATCAGFKELRASFRPAICPQFGQTRRAFKAFIGGGNLVSTAYTTVFAEEFHALVAGATEDGY